MMARMKSSVKVGRHMWGCGKELAVRVRRQCLGPFTARAEGEFLNLPLSFLFGRLLCVYDRLYLFVRNAHQVLCCLFERFEFC
jgi:hypothetical protein